MAKTLADEYHGRQCHMAAQFAAMTMAMKDNRLPDTITVAATTWSLMLEEDNYSDDAYIRGEITRAEWLMAHERMGHKWINVLPKER